MKSCHLATPLTVWSRGQSEYSPRDRVGQHLCRRSTKGRPATIIDPETRAGVAYVRRPLKVQATTTPEPGADWDSDAGRESPGNARPRERRNEGRAPRSNRQHPVLCRGRAARQAGLAIVGAVDGPLVMAHQGRGENRPEFSFLLKAYECLFGKPGGSVARLFGSFHVLE